MNKPYKDGVTLLQIVSDGWARSFSSEQTLREAKEMGFDLNLAQLQVMWANMDLEFDKYMGGTGEWINPEQ